MKAISVAFQIYLIAFVIGLFIAALIKVMTIVIQKITLRKAAKHKDSVAAEEKVRALT